MIVEIIDSILSKVSEGASGNDAFIETFQELNVLGKVEHNHEQKMGKYCTFSDEFYRFLVLNNEHVELYFGPQEEEYGVFFFNEEKDWKNYMFLVKLLAEFKEYMADQKRREWAYRVQEIRPNIPSFVKSCEPSWGRIDGAIYIMIGFSNYTWASQVDPFALLPVVPLNEETAEIVETNSWKINDINIMENVVQIRVEDQYIDFQLFNEYQLANWSDTQLAEYIFVLKNLIDVKPF